MAFSLLNGLSEMGKSTAAFAATAGLEAQKSDLQRQTLMLADQLAGARESAGRQETAGLTSQENRRQETFRSGEAVAADTRITARESAGRREAAALAEQASTPEMKLLRALGVPLAGTSSSSTASAPAPTDAGATWTDSTTPATTIDAAQPTASGANTTNPLIAKHLGLPMPGSDDAVRRAIAEGVTSDPKFKNATLSEQAIEFKKRFASASASLSSDALDTIADRTIAGDTTALTGLGYGEGGAANRAAAQERITEKLKAKGLGGADLAASIANFMGEKAGARTAGTREANVGMAVTEAQLFMPLALEASKAVSRTNFPTLNSIIQAAEKGTGDENIVRLAVATNSLVNAYARAITPSGVPTEGNQTRARELLDKAWSDGQYGAAIDQLGKEMKAAKQSPIQQQTEQRARISGRAAEAPAPGPAPATDTPPAAGPLDAARDAISRGAPRDAVLKRLRDNGIDPGGL